ncbi:MAG TPA: SDR family oxidoreductase [Anaerolineales bacterium]|nr:SDR family oxidoreductase [Anaerolineales bacterium]
MPKNDFKEKVIMISGASSGIGRELARQLAAQGAWLSLAARDAGRLELVAAECRDLGGKALAVRTDVSELAQCEAWVQRTLEQFGRVDVLVNNAGVTMWANFADIQDLSVPEQVMRVNYLGSLYCTHYALPYLRKTKGLIVGISSLTGKTGVPTRSAYAASKHAMAGFFDSLRIELAPSGVGVTMIYPGFVASEVRQRAFGPDGKPLGESPVKEGEVMPVEECARLIVRAMSRRQRELVMTLRGKLGLWLKLIAPGLVDRIASQAIRTGK